MLITSLKQENASQVRIGLSDGALFSLKTGYLPEGFVFGDLPQEISEEEAASLRFANACLRTEKAAASLVANAEQTSFGLSRKLESRGHASACVKAVMSLMEASGIVSDERFAGAWVAARLARKAALCLPPFAVAALTGELRKLPSSLSLMLRASCPCLRSSSRRAA